MPTIWLDDSIDDIRARARRYQAARAAREADMGEGADTGAERLRRANRARGGDEMLARRVASIVMCPRCGRSGGCMSRTGSIYDADYMHTERWAVAREAVAAVRAWDREGER